MTVITKPISEKKIDKLDQPLVTAECLPHQDVESGSTTGSLPPQDPRLLVLHARARRASSITTACLLLMALLVMCCGVLGGFYLYKQFAHSQSRIAELLQNQNESRIPVFQQDVNEMNRLRGWCRIPYEVNEQAALMGDYNKQFPEFQDLHKFDNTHFINEEFDIDGDLDSYEKITVPTFDGGRNSRFIHDFNSNKTGIIDMEAHRCFVLPLNRTQVLPPKDLIDLVRKMWQGYYDVDTATVKETMRVVLPPVKDPRSLYIERECAGYPIYKLEKIVSGVYKRSISGEPVVFTHFSGKKVLEVAIVNEEELKKYEMEHNHT